MARSARRLRRSVPGNRPPTNSHPIRLRQSPESCGTITVEPPAFDTNNLTVESCHLNNGQPVQAGSGQSVSGAHTWQNGHDESANHAYVRASVRVGGTVVPIAVDTGPQYRRQADSTTYEAMVPAGESATVSYDVQVADLPIGSGLGIEIVPDTIEARSLEAF